MNIEEANDNLIMLKYFLQEEGDENWEKYCESIETLLTAYEKQNKIIDLMAEDIIKYETELGYEGNYKNEEEVIKYFKERCHNG